MTTSHTPRATSGRVPAGRRALFTALVVAVSVVGIMAVTSVLVATTANASAPTFAAPPLVQYGLPVAKALTNTGIAVTLGSVVLAAFVLPRNTRAWSMALDVGAVAAASTTALAAATAVAVFADIAGPVEPPRFVATLAHFLTQIAAGQGWVATILAFSVIAVLAFSVRSAAAVHLLVVASVLALVPLALQGHAAGAGSHVSASTALWLHVAGSSVWSGGLLVLAALVHRTAGEEVTAAELARFSRIALICFITVVLAGTLSALLRFSDPQELVSTAYGRLVIAKVVLLAFLGGLGAWYRLRAVRRWNVSGTKSTFWRIACIELALMGVALGLAVVLARTPPPVLEQIAVSPSERLTGLPLPSPLTIAQAVGTFSPDALWLLVGGLGAAAFGVATRRVPEWPKRRTVFAVASVLLLVTATCGWLTVYGTYLVSVRTIAVLVLALAVPALAVVSRPDELLAADINRPRWIRHLDPAVAGLIVSGALVLPLTPLAMRWSVEDPIGVQLTRGLLLLSGAVFFATVRQRAIESTFSSVAAWLVPGLTLVAVGIWMSSGSLFSPDWYGRITEGWPTDPTTDQRLAGTIAVASGSALLALGGVLKLRSRLRRTPVPGQPDHAS